MKEKVGLNVVIKELTFNADTTEWSSQAQSRYYFLKLALGFPIIWSKNGFFNQNCELQSQIFIFFLIRNNPNLTKKKIESSKLRNIKSWTAPFFIFHFAHTMRPSHVAVFHSLCLTQWMGNLLHTSFSHCNFKVSWDN